MIAVALDRCARQRCRYGWLRPNRHGQVPCAPSRQAGSRIRGGQRIDATST
jgi:hypothetical protein